MSLGTRLAIKWAVYSTFNCDLISSQLESNNIQCYKRSCLCVEVWAKDCFYQNPSQLPPSAPSLPPLPVEMELSKVPFPFFESHSFSHSRNETNSKLFTEGER